MRDVLIGDELVLNGVPVEEAVRALDVRVVGGEGRVGVPGSLLEDAALGGPGGQRGQSTAAGPVVVRRRGRVQRRGARLGAVALLRRVGARPAAGVGAEVVTWGKAGGAAALQGVPGAVAAEVRVVPVNVGKEVGAVVGGDAAGEFFFLFSSGADFQRPPNLKSKWVYQSIGII